MNYYERRLPHWTPEGKALFVTWRLYGSLPAAARTRALARIERGKSREGKSGTGRSGRFNPSAGERFRAVDRELDGSRFGPKWLRDPDVARALMDVLRRGENEFGHYRLHAFVIMPNHVHILMEPCFDPARILRAVKGTGARAANRILGRTGRRFWQDESYDHWVRSAAEFERIRSYIERNPVAARLARRPEDWSWSSASWVKRGK